MRGKVTRGILEKAFGSVLLKAVEDYKKDNQRLSGSASASMSAATGRRPGEEKSYEEEQDQQGGGGGTKGAGVVVDTLAGTDTVAGKLQASQLARWDIQSFPPVDDAKKYTSCFLYVVS